jgi:hypothetical protein
LEAFERSDCPQIVSLHSFSREMSDGNQHGMFEIGSV